MLQPSLLPDNIAGDGLRSPPFHFGMSFAEKQNRHLVGPDGFTQSAGISGTHNSANFLMAVNDNGARIVGVKPGSAPGLVTYEYAIPSKDKAGNVTGYKSSTFNKTVYDPMVYSDAEVMRLGQMAAAKGYHQAVGNGVRQYSAEAGGIKFRIYIDKKTGEVTNFHPE